MKGDATLLTDVAGQNHVLAVEGVEQMQREGVAAEGAGEDEVEQVPAVGMGIAEGVGAGDGEEQQLVNIDHAAQIAVVGGEADDAPTEGEGLGRGDFTAVFEGVGNIADVFVEVGAVNGDGRVEDADGGGVAIEAPEAVIIDGLQHGNAAIVGDGEMRERIFKPEIAFDAVNADIGEVLRLE